MPIALQGVPETLLIPLWARAVETARPDALVKDPVAVDWVRCLDYDFSKFTRAWASQVGVAVRTEILDQVVSDFIRERPHAVIINLGAGLDTRFFRLDNGSLRWYDLDLLPVIELKRKLVQPAKRYHLIGGSILDPAWRSEISVSSDPVLIIAEGLLFYLEEQEVRRLFDLLLQNFPRAEMLLELLGPAFVGRARWNDSVGRIPGVEFRWSMKESREFERWNAGIRFVQEWYVTDYHHERWGWLGQVTRFGLLKRWLSNRIVHLKFNL